jgi:hypothetical protein
MNRIALFILSAALFTGCASTTIIRSNPSGATVKDSRGNVLGTTPYEHSDTRMNGHAERFVVELEEHEPRSFTIRRDKVNAGRLVGFGLGGFFAFPVWAGLLWMNDYEDQYRVSLKPTVEEAEETPRKKVAVRRRR